MGEVPKTDYQFKLKCSDTGKKLSIFGMCSQPACSGIKWLLLMH